MSLWKLEWLRLLRTRRLMALAGVFGFFGLTSAPLARYMSQLLERFGGGVQISTPPASAVDGFTNYVSNAYQLGLLVFALVVASALAFNSQRETAVFLRTRVSSVWRLILPKYLVNCGAGASAFTVGVLATWYGTVLLLGGVDVIAVVVGDLFACAYLAFIAALAAALASRLASVAATTIATLVVALALGILASVMGDTKRWLPSALPGALTDLVRGAPASDYLPAALVTIGVSACLLLLAERLSASREL